MSTPEAARHSRPRGELRLTVALWLAVVATMVPLLRVVSSGTWLPGAALLAAVLLWVGFGLRRRRRMPAVAVTLAEFVVWALAITAVFLPETSFLRVIPTGGVVEAVPSLVQEAAGEILEGVAPLAPTVALSFVIVAALGLLTIALDHVVLTARMPLLAAVALVIVWLIPAVSVPAEVDVVAFVVLAATLLYLIRAETRTRESSAARAGGVTAVAATIGVVAIVGAVVGGPALPPPAATAGGTGMAASIDPSLDLGDDLRRHGDAVVLTFRSDAPQLPNLRVATLSLFDGAVWQPDRPRAIPLTDAGLDAVTAADGVAISEYRTNVEVTRLSSAYLPVPFPAVGVTGLSGDWQAVPYSRTLFTGQSNAQGQRYEVVSQVPRPTLEQIRAVPARVDDAAVDVTEVPADTPAVVADTARAVTAAATTDYDRLLALQSWFRGPEFAYSLDTPVEEGFDGAGVDAVAAFLERKEGYCVHFAGAFALMARTLGMPSRIVVGFLPGDDTGDAVDGQRVAAVTTSQLHAWPEVFFEGIGWVAFEPTKSLGTPTRFVSAADAAGAPGDELTGASSTPTAAATPSAAPMDRPDTAGDASAVAARGLDLGPLGATTLVVLLVVAAPGVVGWARRRVQRVRGGTADAWRAVQDAALDLGVAAPLSESPRAFGARLMTEHGAPVPEMSRLVAAVERANYAPPHARASARRTSASASADRAGAFADAEAIRAAMFAEADGREQLRATLLPRSLVIRPSSAFADRDARA
ncbi:transglutaminase family protein [Microbacterium lacticum]